MASASVSSAPPQSLPPPSLGGADHLATLPQDDRQPVASSSAQLEFEGLRTLLQQKDQLIQTQMACTEDFRRTLEQKSKDITALQARLKENREKLSGVKESNAELEQALGIVQTQKLNLERQIVQIQKAQGGQLLLTQRPPEELSVWQKIWGGFTSVGRFCRENRRLFEGGAAIAGAVLVIYFSPYAIPIVLAVTGGIALFDWITSFF